MAASRYNSTSVAGPRSFPWAVALRRSFAQGYDKDRLRADLLAGAVVGIVALPLSMALAIAVGVPPQHGLYTAVIAGVATAVFGGSKHQVTGPTAAFIVILAPIAAKHGLSGLLTAGLMAGVLLLVMGIARLGKLIEFIPHPVTTGFTAGIATVIATLQLKDIFGLKVAAMPDHFVEKVEALWAARGTASLAELGVAALTFALLLLLPKLLPQVTRIVPAPLIALAVVGVGATLLAQALPGFEVATIGSRFETTIGGTTYRGIPPLPPLPQLPWADMDVTFHHLRELLPAAFAIAMLGAIESLLSAVIADAMTGKKHDPDGELVGLGVGNIVAPFFGGIAATGALARTATNVRSGATSPIAAVVHSIVILAAILLLAPLVSFIPMASLAGLLLLVAWNMSEVRHFAHTARVAPRSDVIVLLTCYFLTVVFDMVVAVSVGVVLASLLFMRRMAELTSSRVFTSGNELDSSRALPVGLTVYEIAGPLFFGAAQKAIGAIEAVGQSSRVVVLSMERVPAMDATGLVALESVLLRLAKLKRRVIIAGAEPQPRSVIERADLLARHDNLELVPSVDEAVEVGAEWLKRRVSMSGVNPAQAAPKA